MPSLRYTVTFDESVSGVDGADFTLALTGTASGRIASVTRIDGRTYQVLVDNLSGAGNVRLDLNASNTGIVDVAGNPISGGLDGSTYTIDRVAPTVTSVTVPASGTYTFTTNPANGNTIVLNGVTWTFTTGTPSGAQTKIQSTVSDTLVALVRDLNASGSASLNVATYTLNGLVVTITYDAVGAGGNAYPGALRLAGCCA